MCVEDQYPSTVDMARVWEHDQLLDVLVGGRERLDEGHCTSDYVCGRKCCAVGSVLVVGGYRTGVITNVNILEVMEKVLSDAAKEAIRLLNAKAVQFYPESAASGCWSGPFEFVNQESVDAKSAKRHILRIYDAVIKDRRAELAEAVQQPRRTVARKQPVSAKQPAGAVIQVTS